MLSCFRGRVIITVPVGVLCVNSAGQGAATRIIGPLVMLVSDLRFSYPAKRRKGACEKD